MLGVERAVGVTIQTQRAPVIGEQRHSQNTIVSGDASKDKIPMLLTKDVELDGTSGKILWLWKSNELTEIR